MLVGYTGADIAALCRDASLHALDEAVASLRDGTPPTHVAPKPTGTVSSPPAVPNDVAAPDGAGHGHGHPGRVVVEWRHFEDAMGRVGASALRAVAPPPPTTTWDDIGGLEEVKHKLRQVRVLAPLLGVGLVLVWCCFCVPSRLPGCLPGCLAA